MESTYILLINSTLGDESNVSFFGQIQGYLRIIILLSLSLPAESKTNFANIFAESRFNFETIPWCETRAHGVPTYTLMKKTEKKKSRPTVPLNRPR